MFSGFVFIKISIAVLLWVLTSLGRHYWLKRYDATHSQCDPWEPFIRGIFLGTALFHCLPDAFSGLSEGGINPYFSIAGSLLFFLLLAGLTVLNSEEHHPPHPHCHISLIICLVLGVHVFFEGTALGMQPNFSTLLILTTAVLMHKFSEIAAFHRALNKALPDSLKLQALFWGIFQSIATIGVLAGIFFKTLGPGSYWDECCDILTAGTFFYLASPFHQHEPEPSSHTHPISNQLIKVALGMGIMAFLAYLNTSQWRGFGFAILQKS